MAKYITLNGSDGSGGLKHFLTDLRSTKFKATSDKYGGIKLGYIQTNKNYPVQLDNDGKAYVNVPWENTTYTWGPGFVSEPEGVKLNLMNFTNLFQAGAYIEATSSTNFYSVCFGGGPNYLSVYVPWRNDSCTHVDNHYRPSGQDQKNETTKFCKISIDKAGHISNTSEITKQDILDLGISDSGGNVEDIEIEDISHAGLWLLRYRGELTPGKKYRITDYTALLENDTYMLGDIAVTSKKNIFKILIKAITSNELSEDVKIENGNLIYDAKYCIENDTDRFKWATNSGKGVIYYMKDEYGNEAPYDFKNILFDGVSTYDADSASDNFIGCLINTTTNKKIYELPYNLFEGHCANNKIGTNSTNNKLIYSNYNTIGNNCNGIIITGAIVEDNIDSNYNIIGDNCNNIYIGNHCNYNTIGNSCNDISFGNSCNDNTIGNSCNDISFGNSCNDNTIGNNCQCSNWGDNCKYNTVVDGNKYSGILFKYKESDSVEKNLNGVENCIFNNSTKIYLQRFSSDYFSDFWNTSEKNLDTTKYTFKNIEFLAISTNINTHKVTEIITSSMPGESIDNIIAPQNFINRSNPVLYTMSSCVIRNYHEINF